MISRLVLTYLHREGYTSRKAAKKLGVSKSTVLKSAGIYGIQFANISRKPNYIDPVIVKKLVRRGYSNREIAKMLNTSSDIISVIKQRNNLKSSNYTLYNKYKEVKVEDREFALLIGCFYGDGSVSKDGRFTCGHSMAQRDYCLWKAEQLESKFSVTFTEGAATYDERTHKTYYSCRFYIKATNKIFKEWREKAYIPKKEITKDLLKYYTDLSLAVHFMDDGSKTNSSYRIATNSFSTESLNTFIKFCEEKFKITFTIGSENRLYLPIKYKNRFENIIRPFIHPTLMYKLH